MAYEPAPPATSKIAHFTIVIRPETRAGILPKRSAMSKRKLHECVTRAPHTIHSFSTERFSMYRERKDCEKYGCLRVLLRPDLERASEINKHTSRRPVEICFARRLDSIASGLLQATCRDARSQTRPAGPRRVGVGRARRESRRVRAALHLL